MSNETEHESILRNPEVFHDDSFLPDLELDIMTSRPASHSEGGCMDVVFRYIHECDFCKVLPTFLVSNAFSCSITVMTTCRIVHRTGHIDDTNTAIDDQFGLWSYTDSKGECQSYDFKSPTSIVSLGDQLFRSARGLAIAGTCLGFFAMAGMWMGALREHVGRKKSRIKRARWKVCVGGGLILCSIIEGMTLLVLHSEACHSTTTTTTENSSRLTCRLGDEGWWVLAGTLQYLVTGFLVLGWPNASKNYKHSSLAGDESEEGEHAYPAEVADADALWDGFWKGLGSEEVELGNMPMTPYRDHVEQVTNLAGNPSRPMLPQQQQASQSLRDLLLAFDSELVSFEPMNPDHHYTSAVVAATKPPYVELPPSPRVIEPPSVSLERLRQQSKIAARADVVVAGVDQGEDAPKLSSPSSATSATSSMSGVELGSRDSLKSMLNGFVVPSVNGRRQQQSNSNPSWQYVRSSWRVPTATTQDPPRRSLNFLLDAFDDDIT